MIKVLIHFKYKKGAVLTRQDAHRASWLNPSRKELMMQSVTETPTSRKPAKAFDATYHSLSGVITKPGDAVLFLEHERGSVVTLTEADDPHLMVLGEVAEAMQQYVADMTAGGYVAIATSRQNEGVAS
jgi:hypothetical protein